MIITKRKIDTIEEMAGRLIHHHDYWHEHDRENSPFNYKYLLQRDAILIRVIDRKMFGINGLPDAFEIAGINPLCHLRGVLYKRNASLEERRKRYLKVLFHLVSEMGNPNQLNDGTMNSRRAFTMPSSFLGHEKYEICEEYGCQPILITFQSVYARGRGLFGNWNNVLRAAGFNYKQIRRKKPKYTRSEVMRDLLQFMEKMDYKWSFITIRKNNSPLHKGIFNSHDQSPFYFANLSVQETAFIEMQYLLEKTSDPEISPEEFCERYKILHSEGIKT